MSNGAFLNIWSHFSFVSTFKLWWYRAFQICYGSRTSLTIGGFDLLTFCIQCIYLSHWVIMFSRLDGVGVPKDANSGVADPSGDTSNTIIFRKHCYKFYFHCCIQVTKCQKKSLFLKCIARCIQISLIFWYAIG